LFLMSEVPLYLGVAIGRERPLILALPRLDRLQHLCIRFDIYCLYQAYGINRGV